MIYAAALCLHENKAKQIGDVIGERQYFSCFPPLHRFSVSGLGRLTCLLFLRFHYIGFSYIKYISFTLFLTSN